MNETVKKHFEYIKLHCSPYKPNGFGDIFDMFFGGSSSLNKGKEHNFVGGMNDTRRTLHESMFHLLYPGLKAQVHFGTGKGGLEQYLSKRFTADFLYEENWIVYEIDGRNHENELQQSKDRMKKYFLIIEHGYKTIRFTNEEVEQMVIARLKELYEEGALDAD